MSHIVIELCIGTPLILNLFLILNSFYSLFLSHKIQDNELNSFYNKSLSNTYNCISVKKYYYQQDFDRAEILVI